MKYSPLLTACLAMATLPAALAQSAAQGSDGHYLPVQLQVTMNGGRARQFNVTLFKDNKEVTTLPPSRHDCCELALELNAYYTIRITKEDYQEKLIQVDTHLPDGVDGFASYPCQVDLEPAGKFTHSDPFYLDFPCALVRWDAERRSFDHSDPYLADIQLKVALLGMQVGTD